MLKMGDTENYLPQLQNNSMALKSLVKKRSRLLIASIRRTRRYGSACAENHIV